MSELDNRAWAAKILRGLKENSRRFAESGKEAAKPRTKNARGRSGKASAKKPSRAVRLKERA